MVVGEEGTPVETVVETTPEVTEGAPELKVDPIEVDETQLTDPVAEKRKNLGIEAAPKEGEPPAGDGTPVEGPFTPSFKFRYADPTSPTGKAEKDMPEWLHGVVTNKEQEAYLKELHEKAGGLDFVANKFHAQAEKLTQSEARFNNEHLPLLQALRKVGKAVEAKDLDTVFSKFKINPIDVYKWVDSKLKYDQMSPEQRQEFDRNREFQTRARDGEDQLSRANATANQRSFELRNLQLETAVATPHVSAAAQKFDALYSKGAFVRQVIQTGQLAAQATPDGRPGRDISVAEAIHSVIQAFRLDASPTPPAAPLAASAAPGTSPASQPKKEVPVIPHVSGRNAAPAGKMISSIKEIRELAKQRQSS